MLTNFSDLDEAKSFVILDANTFPGGAWQHRWDSLTVGSLNAIFDLPGMPKPHLDPQERSSFAVPKYFAEFEKITGLPIVRPARVSIVKKNIVKRNSDGENTTSAHASPRYTVLTDTCAGTNTETAAETDVWQSNFIINATGTWNNPVLPSYPGAETFLGKQVHTRDYVSTKQFEGLCTAVVGGGISALQQLDEISAVTKTFWFTRSEPNWRKGRFDTEAGRETIAKVTADVEAGKPTGSVVSYTGLPWADYVQRSHDRGALERRPMFSSIEPLGVREADGSFTSVDAILWATGFKADLQHLEPLQLRNELGGIKMRGTQVAEDNHLNLIGFGPSQSTVEANRAGRAAAQSVVQTLLSS